MKLYSDIPSRRAVQVAADVGIVLWVVLWVRIAQRVHDATMALAAPGRNLAGAGSSFRDTMSSAGDNVDDLPLLDDRVATPFRSAAGVGTEIEKAGTDLVSAVERVSLLLAVTTALVPILIVGAIWLVLRLRFVRRASAAQRFIDAAPDLDLFALRAMANQPMPRLAKISDDPAGAWRRGELDVIHALALLELKDSRPAPTAPRHRLTGRAEDRQHRQWRGPRSVEDTRRAPTGADSRARSETSARRRTHADACHRAGPDAAAGAAEPCRSGGCGWSTAAHGIPPRSGEEQREVRQGQATA